MADKSKSQETSFTSNIKSIISYELRSFFSMAARPRRSEPLTNCSPSPSPFCFFHYCNFLTHISLHHSKSSSSPHSIIKTPKKRRPNSTYHLIPSLLLIFLVFGFPCFFVYTRNMLTQIQFQKMANFDSTRTAMVPLPVREIMQNHSAEEVREFWRQPDAMAYLPCIKFSLEYKKASRRIVAEKSRFLVVVASGGLNQQRKQIVDAVVIARILGAALVVPSLKVNVVWGDESTFSDIFDVDHFKKILESDIRVVKALPKTHLWRSRSPNGPQIPFNSSPFLIRSILLKQLKRDSVVTLNGLDSKLSKRLPTDLQKLRCKVAFHALRFNSPIHELGNKLAKRMWDGGPYVAIHLRLEKDVWVRTGCLPGLRPELDKAIIKERESHPELLTGRLSMSHDRRKLTGLCPLTANEVARFLKALGAPPTIRLYLAGGEPFGGKEALLSLTKEFPNSITKESLATSDELKPYIHSPSALAALDFMISLSSDVFVPSHGGNMGRALQGYRSYGGGRGGMQRKVLKPNKRGLATVLGNSSVGMTEEEISFAVRRMHSYRRDEQVEEGGGDVIAYPTSACMCRTTTTPSSFASTLSLEKGKEVEEVLETQVPETLPGESTIPTQTSLLVYLSQSPRMGFADYSLQPPRMSLSEYGSEEDAPTWNLGLTEGAFRDYRSGSEDTYGSDF